MPNTYFQFKQFRIEQANCAMRVSTDACILGAYTAHYYTQNIQNILDIGAGTGLLSLMLAQVSRASITAIEIDEKAYLQAKSNFAHSPWADRLHIAHQSLQAYTPSCLTIQYDLIVCNPPFFVNSLKSQKKDKNLARHTDSLSFEELIVGAEKLTHQNSLLIVLLPTKEAVIFEKNLECLYLQSIHWQITKKLFVADNPSKPPHRVILTLEKLPQRSNLEITSDYLVIKDAEGAYSNNFVNLMQDYYLCL